MRIIDAQIHLWEGPDAPPHHTRAPFTIEAALDQMDAAGIDRAVNCPPVWDANANAYAALAADRHPDRFATMGWFPLGTGGDDSLVDAAISQPGARGLRFLLIDPAEVSRAADGSLDWLWQAAHDRELPVALMMLPDDLPLIGTLAARFPRMRLMIDHLAVLPWLKVPDATAHLDTLTNLAAYPNVAVKATGTPNMATDPYPFASTQAPLRRVVDAYGPDRVFWGTDITRMPCSWTECVTAFTEHLPWLTGRDLELIMGEGVATWLRWP